MFEYRHYQPIVAFSEKIKRFGEKNRLENLALIDDQLRLLLAFSSSAYIALAQPQASADEADKSNKTLNFFVEHFWAATVFGAEPAGFIG